MLSINRSVFKSSHNLYLAGIFSVCIGLSLSKPLLSLGQALLGIAWIIDGNLKEKIRSFFTSSVGLALISYYLLTLVGLAYTSNFDFALDDLRRKIPLFVFPFILYSKSFTKEELKLIFKVYVAGVLISSFWSIFVKLGGLGVEIIDVRNLSRFNSHIRFGLEICVAIFGSGYYWFKSNNSKEKIVWSFIIVWLLIFMGIISLFTGIAVFILTTIFLSLLIGYRAPSKLLKFIYIITPITLIVISFIKIHSNYSEFYKEVSPLKEKTFTIDKSRYFHDKKRFEKENGYYIWRNNSRKELTLAWNKRSSIHLDSNDLTGQPISTTLTRFITSKGMYKDRSAVESLTEDEVKAIENGVANYKFMTMSNIDRRIYNVIWEYDNYINGGRYNGHSVIMRLEYWKTGLDILNSNLLYGVGTGDIQDAFDQQYDINNSSLTEQYRLRAHNQYITSAATYGLIGIVVFFLFLFYPMIKTQAYQNYIYLSFFIIVAASMLTEDTLDTQIGITFFAFFNSLFLFNKKQLE